MKKYQFIFSIVCLLFLAMSQVSAQDQTQKELLVEGDILSQMQYDLVLTTLDGKTTTTLGKLAKNKVVVLDFWAYSCPPCVMEMPDFQKLYDTYKDNPDVVFIFAAVNSNSRGYQPWRKDVEETRKFINDKGFQLPIYVTSTTESAERRFKDRIPTSYVIDKNGKVSVLKIGYELGSHYWSSPEFKVLLDSLLMQ